MLLLLDFAAMLLGYSKNRARASGASTVPPPQSDKKLSFRSSCSGLLHPPKESFRFLDVFLHNSALVSSPGLSLRQYGEPMHSAILTSYHQNPRVLEGSYEGSMSPRKS